MNELCLSGSKLNNRIQTLPYSSLQLTIPNNHCKRKYVFFNNRKKLDQNKRVRIKCSRKSIAE